MECVIQETYMQQGQCVFQTNMDKGPKSFSNNW